MLRSFYIIVYFNVLLASTLLPRWELSLRFGDPPPRLVIFPLVLSCFLQFSFQLNNGVCKYWILFLLWWARMSSRWPVLEKVFSAYDETLESKIINGRVMGKSRGLCPWLSLMRNQWEKRMRTWTERIMTEERSLGINGWRGGKVLSWFPSPSLCLSLPSFLLACL